MSQLSQLQKQSTTLDLLHLHEKAANILRLRQHCLDNGKKPSPYLTEKYIEISKQIFQLTLNS